MPDNDGILTTYYLLLISIIVWLTTFSFLTCGAVCFHPLDPPPSLSPEENDLFFLVNISFNSQTPRIQEESFQ